MEIFVTKTEIMLAISKAKNVTVLSFAFTAKKELAGAYLCNKTFVPFEELREIVKERLNMANSYATIIFLDTGEFSGLLLTETAGLTIGRYCC